MLGQHKGYIMRKFRGGAYIDPKSFEIIAKVHIKYDDGTVINLLNEKLAQVPESKYSPAQLAQIDCINKALLAKNLPAMNESEIDDFFDPGGLKQLNEKINTPADMQYLAGFKAEKHVVVSHVGPTVHNPVDDVISRADQTANTVRQSHPEEYVQYTNLYTSDDPQIIELRIQLAEMEKKLVALTQGVT